MKYQRILMAVAAEAWAMEPTKLGAMLDIIRFAAEGGKLTPDEVRANLEVEAAKLPMDKEQTAAESHGAVAVLGLSGVISNRAPLVEDVSSDNGTSAERFTAAFRDALEDDETKAIIIDTNSPGGSVSGVPELADEIYNARGQGKPIVAHVNALNASAAYWVTSAADEIVATPSSQIGSIGVYTLHEDVSKMFEEAGVDPTLISAGKYKVEGNPFEPLSDAAYEFIQSTVNDYYDMFVEAVARNRGDTTENIKNGYGQGRTLTAKRALEAGLIDDIATLDETLARFSVGPKAQPRQQPAPQGRSRARAEREIELLELDSK